MSIKRTVGMYPTFGRSGAVTRASHYCAGCGHGIVHKLITEALKDYSKKTIRRAYESLDEFLNLWNAAERKQNVLEARLAERGLLHAYESTKKALQKIDDAQGYLDPEDEERLLKLATAYAAMDDVLHSMIRECRE